MSVDSDAEEEVRVAVTSTSHDARYPVVVGCRSSGAPRAFYTTGLFPQVIVCRPEPRAEVTAVEVSVVGAMELALFGCSHGGQSTKELGRMQHDSCEILSARFRAGPVPRSPIGP